MECPARVKVPVDYALTTEQVHMKYTFGSFAAEDPEDAKFHSV